jgi:hypothetical protein
MDFTAMRSFYKKLFTGCWQLGFKGFPGKGWDKNEIFLNKKIHDTYSRIDQKDYPGSM